jgi:AraC-like DNA-binding protein
MLDPALEQWTVSAIGASWGFTNPAHFSRTFRAAYGSAPLDYRRTASLPNPAGRST